MALGALIIREKLGSKWYRNSRKNQVKFIIINTLSARANIKKILILLFYANKDTIIIIRNSESFYSNEIETWKKLEKPNFIDIYLLVNI